MVCVEHAGLVQHTKGGVAALHDDLVASRPRERPLRVRPEVRLDAEVAEQSEREARDDRLGDIEVEEQLATSAEVQPSRGVKQAGELREPVAVLSRRDLGELAPDVLRE
jgi:hypothetical protein